MLRWLFLILLLCNLALFAWGYRQAPPEHKTPTPLPEGAPTILLIDEDPTPPVAPDSKQDNAGLSRPEQHPPVTESEQLDESTRSNAADGTESAADDRQDAAISEEPPRPCVRLGPLDEEHAAFDVIAVLTDRDHEPELKVVNDKEQVGYWVLIVPGDEDPDFVVSNLELAGINDVWRFTKGDLAGTVSLGLYSSKEEAEERRQELADKHFDSEIKPRFIDKYTYWIETRYDPGSESASAALEQVFNQNHWLEFPPAACKEIASTGENP
jgi:hypothetical protein